MNDVVLHEVARVDEATAVEVARIHEGSAVPAYAHIFDSPFPREETEQRWSAYAGRIVIARRGDQALGFVAWHDDELYALYVLPEASGSGVGTALMEAAEGATRLWVLRDNEHAKGFYEAKGWRPSGQTRSVYEGVDEEEYLRQQGAGRP